MRRYLAGQSSGCNLQAAALAPLKNTPGDALRCPLKRGDETKERERRAEHPYGDIERGPGKPDGAAAQQLDDRPRAAALFLGQLGETAHVGGLLGDLQSVEGGARPRLFLDARDIAC